MASRLPSSLSRLPSLARLEALSFRGMKLGLAAIDALCDRLGRPERQIPSVLIAGTNGKGSTAATLSSIARACGLRSGLYTSPHLIDVTERLRVDERDVAPGELDRILGRVFDAASRAPEIPVTYFEALTAAAFLLFADRRLDLAILEVGLGGRWDATNIAPSALSLVTSIGLDHTRELGDTLSQIANEKAGVFRRDRPALVRAASPEALSTLHAASDAAGSWWHDGTAEISLSDVATSLSGTRLTVVTPKRRLALSTPLPGSHQAWNTALAVRAAELFEGRLSSCSDQALAQGVAAVRWPGRLEVLSVSGRPVLLDGCHNAEGAESLAFFLAETGLAGRCELIFGAMGDKPIERMAEILFPCVARVVLVPAPSPRAATSSQLLRRVGSLHPSLSAAESVDKALVECLAGPRAEPIIVAGSLYLVGQARRLLLEGGSAQVSNRSGHAESEAETGSAEIHR